MPVPQQWHGRLKLPVIAAPMFLVSGPDLVVASVPVRRRRQLPGAQPAHHGGLRQPG